LKLGWGKRGSGKEDGATTAAESGRIRGLRQEGADQISNKEAKRNDAPNVLCRELPRNGDRAEIDFFAANSHARILGGTACL